ncbi:kinase [Saccharibacillus kuerlensis]|uniref:kinase n=1 Tax=Saccharibacillus kuerlensis TaxID=459527 RepID=UPI0012EE7663
MEVKDIAFANAKKIYPLLPGKVSERRFVLGIDGLSRSGKTSLTAELKRRLVERGEEFVLLHIDDYITARSQRYHTGHEEWYEYYALQWNAEKLRKDLFENLKTASQLTLPVYDEQVDSLETQTVHLPERGIIVVEGVFLQRSEWRGYCDFVVYLDCPREERFKREGELTQSRRDKFVNRYWKAEDYYLKTERPTEQAHLVLNG